MILSIDPGNRGAIAGLSTRTGDLLALHDMTLKETGSTGHMRYFVDGSMLSRIVTSLQPVCAILERVASMPGQGVSGIFAFGRGVGTIEGVLASADVPISYVAPQVWKRYHGLIKQPKEKSLELAREFYPDAELHLKKHEGRAEAILIGVWKLEMWGNRG